MSTTDQTLLEIERRLDPSDPTRCGVEVLGYGEVSAVLGSRELPGVVLKRMSGFPSHEAALAYAAVVERYVGILRDLDVEVAPTELIPLQPERGRHIVYVMQPRLDASRFGHALLRRLSAAALFPLIEQIAIAVRRVLDANAKRSDGREVGVDAQLSNWHWPDDSAGGRRPLLIDVSTPFMRKDGVLEIGLDVFLCAYPRPMQWWVRRSGAIERYLEDYYHFEPTMVDLIGNFKKEGAADKIAAMIELVNDWIARQPQAERLGRIDAERVKAYYTNDAATLELSLRARRLSRFVNTKLLRRRYDFILPGRIDR